MTRQMYNIVKIISQPQERHCTNSTKQTLEETDDDNTMLCHEAQLRVEAEVKTRVASRLAKDIRANTTA